MTYMVRFGCLVLALLVLVVFLGGCSSGGNSGGGNAFHVQPASASLQQGGSQIFTAAVPVTWAVLESNGGTVTQTGPQTCSYNAPTQPGTYHLVATSQANPAEQTTVKVVIGSAQNVTALVVAPLADAVVLNEPNGANLVRWPSMGSRVIAYLIYRDTNPAAPVAVVDGSTMQYIDSAIPLPENHLLESTDVNITLDSNTGMITTFSKTPSYSDDYTDLSRGDLTVDQESLSVTCQRIPLHAAQTCGYQIQVLYLEYDPNGMDDPVQHPDAYRLFLGNKSGISLRVTLVTPPELLSPQEGQLPIEGEFRCARVPAALSYVLQVSSDPMFSSSRTRIIPAQLASGDTASASYSFTQLCSDFSSSTGRNIYWRMGARVEGQPLPFGLSDANQTGWVFSEMRFFVLPVVPPPAG